MQTTRPGRSPKRLLPRLALILLAVAALFCTLPTVSLANSGPPPVVVFIVDNPPKDFTIVPLKSQSLGAYSGNFGEPSSSPRYLRRAWEGYYAFYSIGEVDAVPRFRAVGEGVSFEFSLPPEFSAPEQTRQYRDVYLLNLDTQTLTPVDDDLFRKILLVGLRVIATLVIEGLLFLAFRFKKPLSWLSFVLVNLCTQGLLSFMMLGESPFSSYSLWYLLILEIPVFCIELIALPLLMYVTERSAGQKADPLVSRTIIFVLVANLASLILGGYLLTHLPL